MRNRQETRGGQNLDVTVRPNKSVKRVVFEATATGAAILAAGSILLGKCDTGFKKNKEVTIPKAKVVEIKPIELPCRAFSKDEVVATSNVAPGTPFDHAYAIGAVFRAAERTERATSIFTGNQDNTGGKVDTLTCVKPLGEIIETTVDGKGVSHTNIKVHPDEIVQFSGIEESKSIVLRRDGIGMALGQFEFTVVGGILPSMRSTVEHGRAALDAVARAAAINTAQENCAQASWPITKMAIQDSFRMEARAQYDNEIAQGHHLAPFDPNITVEFLGDPSFKGPYAYPPGTHIGQTAHCEASLRAYDFGEALTDPAGNRLPVSLNS